MSVSVQPTESAVIEPEELPQTLDRLQEQVVALHRSALLGTTAAMVAHEFNNLMTPVLLRAQDALDRDDAAAMRKACERAIIQTRKAIGICRHLMSVASAVDDVEQDTCRVADALDEAVRSIYRPFEKDGIDFSASIDRDLTVKVNGTLLHQVFLNLLLNARRAMEKTRGRLAVSALRDDDMVIIEFRDSGEGFPDDRMETQLTPFLRADESRDPRDWLSIGLGLAVCRKIAHEHGAALEASANDTGGCTFRLRWPAV